MKDTMKASSIQVRKNGSTSRHPEQIKSIRQSTDGVEVKSKFGPEFDLPKGECHISCFCTFDRNSQKLTGKVPLTESEFTGVLLACAQGGVSPATFAAEAIRHALTRSSLQSTALDMEIPINKAIAAIELLQHRLEQVSEDNCHRRTVERKLNAGVFLQACEIQAQLADGFDKMVAAMQTTQEEVAS
jgi:hypothetical protein